MSAVRELENETTPRFQALAQNAPGLRRQGRIAGFSSGAAATGFVLDTGATHGLIDIDRLDYLSRDIYAGANISYGSAASGSGTVGGVSGGTAASLSGGLYAAAGPNATRWTGTTGPAFTATATANTATTITISTFFSAGPNTNPLALLGSTTSDPLAGYNRYSIPNWDGYGAKAITLETIAAARRFIRDLPETFGDPDVAPGADGTVGLEWSFRNHPLRKLFIDIGPGNQWSGYWRRASGERRTLPLTAITAATRVLLLSLFDELNS